MPSPVERFSVDERGEGELDSVAELGDVGEAEVQVAVDFGLEERVSVESLLDAGRECGGTCGGEGRGIY